MAVHLYLTSSVEEQWHAVVEPWLVSRGAQAWQKVLPTVVLTPSRAEAFYLRSRLVAQKRSLLGVYFWTPSDARQFLADQLPATLHGLKQADLRLLTRFSANLMQSKSNSESTTCASVMREPGLFLCAYNLLLGAGWDSAHEGVPHGQELSLLLGNELREIQATTQAGLHRHLREIASTNRPPLLNSLLIVGFNAVHWPLWDLLQAITFSALDTTLALSEPRIFGEEVDQLWISSWEEVTRQTYEIPETKEAIFSPGALSALSESYEDGQMIEGETLNLSFLAAADLTTEVRGIVLQALHFLKHDECTRLGIVFPEANALALRVAEQLRDLGIPIDDGTAFIQPGPFEKRSWRAWMALQEEPSVQRLIAWVRACEAEKVSFGTDHFSAIDLAETLDQALGQSLVDDLGFLAAQLEDDRKQIGAEQVARFLRDRLVLPSTNSFIGFLTVTREVLRRLGWNDHLLRIPVVPPKGWQNNDRTLSRKTYLQWLQETTDSRERTRGSESNHFYGKVHLLIYAQAGGQTWSHLILTGLNEGVWPRVTELGAFGSRYEWAALNQQARTLNVANRMEGTQGLGHETVGQDHGYCLLPLERHALALRDLCTVLESTSHAACLTAMTTSAGQSLLPSDFFVHAYQAKTGQVLDDKVFGLLAKTTGTWVQEQSFFFQKTSKESPLPITAARTAYEARRDMTKPFGPYEFAFASPPAQPIQLNCKIWEQAWNHPDSVWLSEVIGVSVWPDGTINWPRVVGTWVHRWLAIALQTCAERHSGIELMSVLHETAQKEQSRIETRAKATEVDLYPWWNHVWEQARSITLGLGESLQSELVDKFFASEIRLPKDLRVVLPGTVEPDFILKGRIDLLLVEGQPRDLSTLQLTDCSAWVIDFKTGKTQTLNPKAVMKGRGIQPLLYALAVQAGGADPISISLHTFDAPLTRQISLSEALACRGLFHSLDIFHRAGIFGQRGDTDHEHGFTPTQPMASRPVSPTILETKWALVHGASEVAEDRIL